MKAKKKPVDVKNAAALGIASDVKAKVAKFVPPPPEQPANNLREDAAQKAANWPVSQEEAKVI